jgi:ribosomal protein S18 acetylase RimI-like enzyme
MSRLHSRVCLTWPSNDSPPATRRRWHGSTRRSTRPVDPELAARYLADERHHLLVAYIDGGPAGFVSATEIFHPDKPTELFLSELDVVPSMRQRGAARALLAELKHVAKERGCASIWVLTSEDNEAAVATYRGAGAEWDGASSIMFAIYLTA